MFSNSIMEFTNRYVFMNSVNAVANATGTEVVIPLRLGTTRVPHFLVEVVSATFSDTSQYSGIVVKSSLSALNYYGADNVDRCMAILGMDLIDEVGGRTFYSLSGVAPKLVCSASLQQLNINLTTLAGVPISLATGSFSVVLKLSYPVQGQTSESVSRQIR